MYHSQFGHGQLRTVGHRRGEGRYYGGHHSQIGGPFGQRSARGPFRVPINIEETATTFEVYVAAPGRSKNDFSVQIKDDVLTIAYQQPQVEGEVKTPNWRHQEFARGEFSRSFQLNGKVETAGISAGYHDGILQVTLPKSPKANEPAQDVVIA
ncbi:heat shock protein HSP20 [Fibrisoma limi BUZ 3]|uniref:Heat shock protein HSP20 n=1 Tax=Fibrisoma limi BUZ 3 TaxID=1185876 RepID=I2GFU7_9BACT|nr:Hsp20/alpha crystallin family protein [Fibrisoma limi]CCH52772.1 heat shock protein HSP20 [Fibrisoma limi BUZ 3]